MDNTLYLESRLISGMLSGDYKTIIIGRNVECIYPGVLDNLKNVKEVIVDSLNQNYVSIDGILYSIYADKELCLFYYPPMKAEETYVMPLRCVHIPYEFSSHNEYLKIIYAYSEIFKMDLHIESQLKLLILAFPKLAMIRTIKAKRTKKDLIYRLKRLTLKYSTFLYFE